MIEDNFVYTFMETNDGFENVKLNVETDKLEVVVDEFINFLKGCGYPDNIIRECFSDWIEENNK